MGLIRNVRATERSGPKTVLGFFAIVLSIAAALTLGLIVALVRERYTALAAAVLVGVFVLFAVVVGWVMISMQRDPSRLVVGPMTGREFLEYQRWTAGDSLTGEYLDEAVIAAGSQARPLGELGSGTAAEEPEGEEK